MDSLLCIFEAAKTNLISFLGEQYLANGISLIMGILGTIAFFMQMKRRLKPVVMQNGDIIFNVTEKTMNNNYWIDLNSIELYITISNLKNAIGIMEDIFVRIYATDTYQPESVVYFANKIFNDNNESEFSPLILSPNSHLSMRVQFGQVQSNRSEKTITKNNHYAIDVFYKLKNKRKPIMIKTIFTYNVGKIENNKLEVINLSMSLERDKYYKVRNKIYQSTYKGITNFYFENKLNKIKRFIYYTPKRYFIGLLEAIINFFKFLAMNILAYFVSRKIIITQGKKIVNPKIGVGNACHRKINDETINRLFGYIEKIIVEMNEGLPDDKKIIITRQGNRFILARFNKQLEVYQPGDSSIYAYVPGGENKINLCFEINESKWGIPYWKHENKFITQYNMAIKILNYFTLHASNPY